MHAYLQIPQFIKSFTFITAFSFTFFQGRRYGREYISISQMNVQQQIGVR